MTYEMKRPCAKCPFRYDVTPYIRPERAEDIAASLDRAEFPCHETTTFDDDGEHVQSNKEKHCAGALIMLEHEEAPSQMMRISERLGMYDRTLLDMSAPVYGDRESFIDAHYDAEASDA